MVKVLGLGLPKTGTSSLTEALRILGYTVHHGYVPHWPNVPNVDALVDTLFTFHWRYAELRYLEAKIIITTREYDTWIESCRRWMGTTQNPRRIPALSVPYFDKDILQGLWQQHMMSLDVRRSHLRLPLETVSWEPLCSYLGCDVPDVPYPWLNQTC